LFAIEGGLEPAAEGLIEDARGFGFGEFFERGIDACFDGTLRG
jgi:hypothetical protein